MTTFEYKENNSGGHWWLNKAHYDNLEKAGWELVPHDAALYSLSIYTDETGWTRPYYARKEFENIDAAICDFQRITGEDYYEPGCSCCGEPHYISEA